VSKALSVVSKDSIKTFILELEDNIFTSILDFRELYPKYIAYIFHTTFSPWISKTISDWLFSASNK
jgi:hypothetical protein